MRSPKKLSTELSSLQERSLDDWLCLLESRHPREIELGLQRIRRVAEALGLGRPASQVVVVAGTNGKGSCVAALYQLLLSAGLRAAAYTSPHLLTFNERISINGQNVSDGELCEAFQRIESCRGDVSLTYFEFTTLAALLLMEVSSLDVAILEVGLGGRLDAVNIVDADVAVVTSIALDHQDWLGCDLNGIAREKLAVGRPGKPVILGDIPPSVEIDAHCPGTPLRYAVDFHLDADNGFRSAAGNLAEIRWGTLPRTSIACALEAWQHLRLPPDVVFDATSLADLPVAGRFQIVAAAGNTLVLDVAHNPAAAVHLAANIRNSFGDISVTAVFAAMADKDIAGIIEPLKPLVKTWLLPELPGVKRAAAPAQILPWLSEPPTAAALLVDSVEEALTLATAVTDKVVLVCGSFFTVAPALQWLRSVQSLREV